MRNDSITYRMLILSLFLFFTIGAFSNNTIVREKINDEPEKNKSNSNDSIVSANDVENVRLTLNILGLHFPNEIYVDSTLAIALQGPEPEEERPISSFYTYQIMNDDTSFTGSYDSEDIENNMDSLISLWNVKQSLSKHGIDSLRVDSGMVSLIPDSVFIERLNKIPSIVHLSYNRVVRNFIELYTERRREQVEVMLGLSDYYFPIFEQALDKYQLPLELRYLPVIESALNPRARSRAGATGLWQFMYYTGKIYGLKANSYVDDRCDPIKATEAAVRYLKDLYDIYGDWTLVIAAYNCGPGNVNKAIRRSGGHRDYWKIYYRLPRETRGYVPAFIAATYAMNYYAEHGLAPREIELPLNTDTLMINKRLHLQQVADVLNIPIQQLRDMNPQYRKDVIPAVGKAYALKIPDKKALAFIDMRDSIYAKDSIYFSKNTVVEIASRRSSKKYFYNAPSLKNKARIKYKVKPGDNLGFISEWFHVRKSDLRYWNNIYRNRIYAGKNLVVYVPKGKADFYKKFNTMSFAAKQAAIGADKKVNPTIQAKKSTLASNTQSSDFVYYKVRRGDNLWSIAKKYPGVSNYDIMKLNNLTSYQVKRLKPGDVLKIKKI